jgi:hypothetical protein
MILFRVIRSAAEVGHDGSAGRRSESAFTYDAECNVYIRPNGHPLRASGTVHDGRVRNYLSQPGDCRVCELKARCTRAPFRKIARDINEDARDYAPAHLNLSDRAMSGDALCSLEGSTSLRSHATERSHWRSRRVSPRRHRAKPQDLGEPSLAAVAKHGSRLLYVSVSGVKRQLPVAL